MAEKLSAELTLVVSSGQKVLGEEMAGKVRRQKFSGIDMVDADTGKCGEALPPGASIIGMYIQNDNAGVGTVDVGLSGGTATDLLTAHDPLAAGSAILLPFADVAAGNQYVYFTATNAVEVSGYILFVAGA